MVNLFDPDGTFSGAVPRAYAVAFCRAHPGWYWTEIETPAARQGDRP